MKKIVVSIFLGFIATAVWALPATPYAIERELSDGTVASVYMHGDEHFHWFTLEDGSWLKENEQGLLEPTEALTVEQINSVRSLSRLRHVSASTQTAYPLNKAPRGLIILVNFKNLTFLAENTLTEFEEMHNGKNYTYNGATGSAKRYFLDQSYGQYEPQFDVVGPVTVPEEYSYYGQDKGRQIDIHADSLLVQACRLAAKSPWNVDFSRYDNNGDGMVDFVYLIYAGHNQAEGAESSTIWPHSSALKDEWRVNFRLNGKYINKYALSSELRDKSGSIRSGVATFCHEFSHVLGLPDLYDTAGDASHKTLGQWDILDYGPYNNKGNTPPAYSAYERFFMGWLTPVVLSEPCTVKLNELNDSRAACLITSTGTHNLSGNNPAPVRFFTLENRQPTNVWDAYLPGHGLLIENIKYSYRTWSANTVNNNDDNLGVDLIEADGVTTQKLYGKSTDAFPAGADHYTPFSEYPITNITEEDGVIYFDFMGGGELLEIGQVGTSLEHTEASDGEIIAIYNLLGQLQPTVTISDLSAGIYIIKTTTGTRKISVR